MPMLPALFLAVFARPAAAAPRLVEPGADFAATEIWAPTISAALPRAAPAPGAWAATFAPLRVSYGQGSGDGGPYQNVTGLGLSASLIRSLTPHVGAGFVASFAQADGVGGIRDTLTGNYGDDLVQGGGAAAAVVADPFDASSRVRLPVALAAGYAYLDQRLHADTPYFNDTLDRDRRGGGFGVTAAVAAPFDAGKDWLWAPYASYSRSFANVSETCASLGSASCGPPSSARRDRLSFGARVAFKPLGLGLLYAAAPGASALSLEWIVPLGK